MRNSLLLSAFLAAVIAGPLLAQDSDPNPLAATLGALGSGPCEVGELTCVTIPVPRDHFANDQSETLDITFAVSLATEPSKGVLIYVVGGPGYSGLAVADDYLSVYDPDTIAQLDVVFFDQRGVGPVHGFSCPEAQKVFDLAEPSLDDPVGTNAWAQAYATDCVAEFATTDLMPFVASTQAIQDIEDFRIAIGAPKVWIYGESYGTQFAQQYATAFPAAISGVILDGVVDLNLSVSGFYGSYTIASEAILSRVFDACADLPGCAADMQGDAAVAYDALAAKLRTAPIPVDVYRADGSAAPVDLTLGAMQYSVFSALYGTYGRAEFLRALAAANRQDYLPMLHLNYYNARIDPETGEGIPDPSWNSASYFAINCADYTEPGADAAARAAGIMADAVAFAPNAPRLLDVFWIERMACAYWPQQGPSERPEQFAGGDYPTIILNGDADPITPISQSYAIMDNLKNGYLVSMQGGPHVIWGRGLVCPDQIAADLLLEGIMPSALEQVCRQDLVEGYEPLTLTGATDALGLAQALETELYLSIPLSNWDGETELTVGCNHGGMATVGLGIDDATAYTFAACEWWTGIVIDGTGLLVELGEAGDGMAIEASVSGDHVGQFVYHNDAFTESWVISGTYDGAEIMSRLP